MPLSSERARKRPRTEPYSANATDASPARSASPASSSSSARSVSPSSSSASSAGDAAFAAALAAEVAAGATVHGAVTALFDADAPAVRGRLCGKKVAAPVLAALFENPALGGDLETVARMCRTVYDVAKREMESIRVPRRRLELEIRGVADVARLIEDADNIVVLTGAGVSVSCGIPDFRSKGGLYDTVLERFGLADPQAIFDLEEFKMDPRLFYSFAKDVMPSENLRPSPTHEFVAELEAKKKLLRNYSQNIDGLECRAGVSENRVILCHGSFLTATCMRKSCRAKIRGSEIAEEVAAGTVPLCRECAVSRRAAPPGGSAEDSDSDEEGDQDAESMGVLKPDIVFFGENLPKRVSENLERDVAEADLLLVLGTSLQVAPVARIPQYFRDSVPRLLVNRELVGYDFDVELLGDCDVVVRELRRALNWDKPKGEPAGDDSLLAAEGAKEGAATGSFLEAHGSGEAADVKNAATPKILEGRDTEDLVGIFMPPRRFLFPGASESTRDTEGSGEERVEAVVEDDVIEMEKTNGVVKDPVGERFFQTGTSESD